MAQSERTSENSTMEAPKIGHPMAGAYRETVAACLDRLDRCDVDGIVALFAGGARLFWPFLGGMAWRPFFERLHVASSDNRIVPRDTLVRIAGAPSTIGFFVYRRGLKDGSEVRFHCSDVFDFAPDGLIPALTIFYDTHPIRAAIGDRHG